MVEQFFTASKPEFADVNNSPKAQSQVRAANAEHMVDNASGTGVIPETGYNGLCQTRQQAANWAVARENPARPEGLQYHPCSPHSLQQEDTTLPQSWNISEAWAEKLIGAPNPDPRKDLEADFASDHLSIQIGCCRLQEAVFRYSMPCKQGSQTAAPIEIG
ncbi:hypothetical protein N7470_007984 [Penicillium chermesinum]|nr:hypothetical protein N7470_007984 [Penicillium chermesinum]